MDNNIKKQIYDAIEDIDSYTEKLYNAAWILSFVMDIETDKEYWMNVAHKHRGVYLHIEEGDKLGLKRQFPHIKTSAVNNKDNMQWFLIPKAFKENIKRLKRYEEKRYEEKSEEKN